MRSTFRLYFALLCTCLLATVTPSAAQAAERLTDKQLDALIADINKGFDTWKGALEKRNYDDAVITSAAGTINVKQFLKDFEKDIETLKDRVSSSYSATPEAIAVLRRAGDVDRRYAAGQGVGASEWSALGTKFAALAAAYGAPWPNVTDTTGVGRLTDKEIATQLQGMQANAKRLANEAGKAGKSADQASVAAVKSQAKLVETTSKEVSSRIKGGRPASAEVGQLLAATSAAGEAASKLPLSPPGRTAVSSLNAAAAAVARAFGQSWTTPATR